MNCWFLLPITLSALSCIGTWAVYGLAVSYNHVCPLGDWEFANRCNFNVTDGCCHVPTISTSGRSNPENSLFTATSNACAFLFLMFCIFHHAHIMDRSRSQALLSKAALLCGCIISAGAFMAGNCNPGYLSLLHYLGAAISFVCLCFYILLLTALTRNYSLSGLEFLLYPARIFFTVIQAISTICYLIFFIKEDNLSNHLSAVFEWILSTNLQLFELSFVVEFYCFSSSMLTVILGRRDEEKSLILT